MASLLRTHARSILDAGLAAAAPGDAVRRALQVIGDRLVLGNHSMDLHEFNRVVVVGAGKAAGAIGAATEQLLGDRLERGLLITKDGHSVPLKDGHSVPLARTELREASHPVPDARSSQGAEAMARLLGDCGEDCLVLALISGGASALLSLPAAGLSLNEKAATNELLLRSGADITACNAVRKHLSRIKGGRAAALAAPATVAALILSDVIGDPPDVIGSGPFAPDPSTYEDALAVLKDHDLLDQVPKAVLTCLSRGVRGEQQETPKPGDPIFRRVHTEIIASSEDSLAACRVEAEALGYNVLDLGGTQAGPAEELARRHRDLAVRILAGDGPIPAPACILSGGEPMVRVRGQGLGGRNQHLALLAVPLFDGLGEALLLSAGTDGTDGPTDAAGAWADGTSASRAAAAGLDPAAAILDCDSYHFFDALGDLLITGPTGTNVMDLHVTLVRRP